MSTRFPNWVPDDTVGTRKETATLLVGTAKENDLVVRHHVSSTRGGFYISDALADLVYDDTAEPEAEPEPKKKAEPKKASTTKTSGNRAEKNTGTDKEQDSA